jgi:hypothetical protein
MDKLAGNDLLRLRMAHVRLDEGNICTDYLAGKGSEDEETDW